MKCPGCGNRDHKDFCFYYTYIGGEGDWPTIQCTLCGWSKVLFPASYNLLIQRMQGENAKKATPAGVGSATVDRRVQLTF